MSESADRVLLEVDGARIGYGRRVVGDAVSLSLHAAEILCLLGPNGSGKSTLFKTILKLLPLQGGRIVVQGKSLSVWTRHSLARCIAYVPQAQPAVFSFSVEEVVLMGRHAHLQALSGPTEYDRQIARRCLEDMGVLALRDRSYTEISGGERQLVLIARALAQEPELLIMDEPTAALDFGNQVRVLTHIRTLRARGLSVLLCTHQPEHAVRVADRIALFKQGQVHYIGKAHETLNAQRLAWLYDLDEALVRANLSDIVTGASLE